MNSSGGIIELDLYQIFITHNRAWTIREIICFSILFFFVSVILFRLVGHGRIALSQAVAGLLLLLFLGIVFASTVFTRNPNGIHQCKLELFWSWKAVYHGSREMLKESLLNMVLLFPAGLLLPFVFHKKMSWWRGLLIGAVISGTIESCQYVFCRGLFEWDDIIHNGFGCMVGCVLGSGLIRSRRK